ncbi:unnamed protein product [Phytophthora fragariaefolia]|uniref:Unnamed protein product n=1 Tax=Phytophthora fragariaefolia TaxID=1490495 RepID=A0A9W7D2W7_9STRA|nr:unnamed protein product [Phytophthora fragariaefolia]
MQRAPSDNSTPSSVSSNGAAGQDSQMTTSNEDEQLQLARSDGSEHKPKRRARYLSDTQRHRIIKRIDNGEKQATLAREYGVTRAAICHIKKNRNEIVARFDQLITQAQEIDRAENFAVPLGEDLMVREIRSSPVLLLMTTLRDRRTEPPAFRRTAGRLMT